MIESMQPRPRRRRAPTRGLLFGAPLDRLPADPGRPGGGPVDGPTARPWSHRSAGPDVVPIALIGEKTPVAPPRVVAFGAMAATWPLVDRTSATPVATGPLLAERRERLGGARVDGFERLGGLSRSEWDRMLGR